jgi:hypothetical protein
MDHDRSLSDNFSLKGHWFKPDAPSNRIAGTLKHGPEQISLELLGQLSASFDGIGAGSDGPFAVIHGETEDGPCSLLNAFQESWSLKGEQWNTTVVPRFVVIGAKVAADEQFRVKSVSFDWPSISEFFGMDSVRIESPASRPDGSSVTVATMTAPPPRHWLLPHSGELTLGWRMRQRDSSTSVNLKLQPKLELMAQEPEPLDWFITRVGRLSQLFTLLTGQAVAPECVSILPANGTPNGLPLFYTRLRTPTQRVPAAMLKLKFGDIDAEFSRILDDWLVASPALLTAISLHDWANAPIESYLESRFLTLCQSLEALSRATVRGHYLPQADYALAESKLVAAIPTDLPQDHRGSLAARIKYGNEWSLRKRIKNLLESLSSDNRQFVCGDANRFRSGIVETRNYLIHCTDELRPLALGGDDLHWACEKMSLLLRILILKQFGIDESLIIKQLNKFGELTRYAQVWKTHRECVGDST